MCAFLSLNVWSIAVPPANDPGDNTLTNSVTIAAHQWQMYGIHVVQVSTSGPDVDAKDVSPRAEDQQAQAAVAPAGAEVDLDLDLNSEDDPGEVAGRACLLLPVMYTAGGCELVVPTINCCHTAGVRGLQNLSLSIWHDLGSCLTIVRKPATPAR